MSDDTLSGISQRKIEYYEGLEIGAVSVKWVRRSPSGEILCEVVRHEGSPRNKIREIFKRYKIKNYNHGTSNIKFFAPSLYLRSGMFRKSFIFL